jgi:hypothetical protein
VAALTPFITAALLRTALSPSTYIAIFDDDNGGDIAVVDASSQVALCIKRAHVRVVSRLGMLYNKIPDGTDSEISDLLVDAELNYAVGISFDRHPEYVRTFGESDRRKAAFDQADGTMEMIQAAILAIVDAPPEPTPRNVGGVITDGGQRVFLDSNDGCRNSGDF